MKAYMKVVKMPEFARLKVGQEGLKQAVMAGGQVIEAYAKINAESTFSDKSTGNLAGSIQTVVTKSTASSAEVAVGPSAVYGRIQELGGWIRPVHAKMLHWVEEGIDIFAHAVYIPARPYLRPAADEHEAEILKAISEALKRAILGGI